MGIFVSSCYYGFIMAFTWVKLTKFFLQGSEKAQNNETPILKAVVDLGKPHDIEGEMPAQLALMKEFEIILKL